MRILLAVLMVVSSTTAYAQTNNGPTVNLIPASEARKSADTAAAKPETTTTPEAPKAVEATPAAQATATPAPVAPTPIPETPQAPILQKQESISIADPVATSSTKMVLPESRERNAIIFSGGVIGAALGYSVGDANDKDNAARHIMYTFVGAVTGFGIGSVMGLKFYPPVAVPTADGRGATAILTVQF